MYYIIQYLNRFIKNIFYNSNRKIILSDNSYFQNILLPYLWLYGYN